MHALSPGDVIALPNYVHTEHALVLRVIPGNGRVAIFNSHSGREETYPISWVQSHCEVVYRGHHEEAR